MQKILIPMLALAAVGACVPSQRYDAAVSEAEELKKRMKDEEGKGASLDAKVKEQEAKIAELEAQKTAAEQKATTLEGQLTDKESERRELQQKNEELKALNDELSKSTKKLAEAKAALEKRSSEYESLAESLKSEIETGKIELSELKGKMTVKLKDKILFASGSTKVGKEGENALSKIAKSLAKVKGKVIRVEGHTDDVPTDPKGPYPSNWELSLARAMAVVAHLQGAGVDPTLLSAAGYGQYHPIAKNNSPENRSKNRRIEIVLAQAQ
jgi:chemotaxis protein MotB